MKILLLGGSRFLGQAIRKELSGAGHELSVLTRGNQSYCFAGECEHLTVDRRNPNDLNKTLSGRRFDVVIDNNGYQKKDIEYLFSVPRFTFDRYFFTSTAWLSRSDKNNLDQKTQSYISGKEGSEDFIRKSSPTPYRIIRPAMILGENDHTMRSFYYLFRILSQKPYFVVDSGTWSFPYVYVNDVARIVRHLIDEKAWQGEIFHAVSYSRISIAQMIKFWCAKYSLDNRAVFKSFHWLKKELNQYFDEEPFFNESHHYYLPLRLHNGNCFEFTDCEMLLKNIADYYFDHQTLINKSLNGSMWKREADLASQAVFT